LIIFLASDDGFVAGCLAAVKKHGMALEHVKEQTQEICLEAVKKNGWSLQYVIHQTPEVCLEAVKNDGFALQFVKEEFKTFELYLAAVISKEYALQYVDIQTRELCLIAVKIDGYTLQHVKEQTHEICLAAIKQNVWALQYVKEQTPEICIAACEENYNCIKLVKPEMYQYIPNIENILEECPIEPHTFEKFPRGISNTDFIDPITIDNLIEGEIYGFIIEQGKWYVAGSLKNINKMILSKFRESSYEYVFVPFKNALVSVEEIKWVRV
jgi:hypothetical protein